MQLVSCIDFRYCSDAITKQEAVEMLARMQEDKESRIAELTKSGYRAYTTAPGWLNYTDDKMVQLCKKYMEKGFKAFKIKIGENFDRDFKRCQLMRQTLEKSMVLMLDSNQIFDVDEAIEWVSKLKEFKPLWIEEPTSPDDIEGHKKIADALRPHGIAVATGEMIANRVMFKQFIQAKAFEYCQVDSARIGGINELLIVYLMANKYKIKVCPHAGGVGLSEMVQHLQFWDFISVSGEREGKYIEFVDQQHDQFVTPAKVEKASYIPPSTPGYSTELKTDCIKKYSYPEGTEWKRILRKKSPKQETSG